MTEMSTNGHLTVRQLAGIVYGPISELDVPPSSSEDRHHFATCDWCGDYGFELGEALLEIIEHERLRLFVPKLPPETIIELCRTVITTFETKED